MKKFTKIILIIAGSLAALGIVFSGIAAVMGAGCFAYKKVSATLSTPLTPHS